MVNEPLLKEAINWARMESQKPEKEREWLQSAWVVDLLKAKSDAETRWGRKASCGTVGCLAGWVVVVSGEKLGQPDWKGHIERTADGKSIMVRARELLGLTNDQASELFRASNEVEDLEEIAEEILGEKV